MHSKDGVHTIHTAITVKVQCIMYNIQYTIYISLHSKVKITSLTDVDAYSGGGALRIYFAKEISSTRNVVKQGYLPGGRR